MVFIRGNKSFKLFYFLGIKKKNLVLLIPRRILGPKVTEYEPYSFLFLFFLWSFYSKPPHYYNITGVNYSNNNKLFLIIL